MYFFIISYGEDSQWVAKINGETIALSKLNSFYYAQQKSIYNKLSNEEIDKLSANYDELKKNPSLDKREFLENLIKQRLVFNKAIDDGMLKNEEVNSLIEMAKEAVVVGYYMKSKYKDQIEVTDHDVNKAYIAQESRFKDIPIEQAKQQIKQKLTQQKLQLKLRDFVETLKEKSEIKRNLDPIIKKYDSAN